MDTTKDPVLAALQQQLDCYQRLAKLAEVQHQYVQNSRTEDLLRVLGQRQELLDQVADLEQCIGPAKRRWHDYLAELAADDRQTAEDSMNETLRLLEQITSADRNDALVLQQRRLNLGNQIAVTTNARRINRTYSQAAYGTPRSSLDVQR